MFAERDPGGVLLSHTVTCAVPSTLEGLTTEFGMGSGMTLPPWPPRKLRANARPILILTFGLSRLLSKRNCMVVNALRETIKSIDELVPVGSMDCSTFTPGLSTT